MDTLTRKEAKHWDIFVQNILRAAPVDDTESVGAKRLRIQKLEANHEDWFKYYFPNYYQNEPAKFHLRSTRRVMNNPEWYEVRTWSRELAKSARTMMEVIKLTVTKQKKMVLLISANQDNAIRLLKPYKLNFEHNPRLINDYGKMQSHGEWTESYFTTKIGATFVAIGAGQTPRGMRNEEVRPDVVLMDDFDADEDCRNPDIIDKKWAWFERACICHEIHL